MKKITNWNKIKTNDKICVKSKDKDADFMNVYHFVCADPRFKNKIIVEDFARGELRSLCKKLESLDWYYDVTSLDIINNTLSFYEKRVKELEEEIKKYEK